MNKTSELYLDMLEQMQQQYGLLYADTIITNIFFFPQGSTRKRRGRSVEGSGAGNGVLAEIDFESKIEENSADQQGENIKQL